MSARDSAPHAAIAIPAGAATLLAAVLWSLGTLGTLGTQGTQGTQGTLSGAAGLAAEPSRLALALAGSLVAALLCGPFQDLALRGIPVAFPLAALVALPPPSGLLAALVLAGAVGLRPRPSASNPLGRLASFGWALTRGGIGAGLATLALSVITADEAASRFLLSQSEVARDMLLAAAALAVIVAADALLALPWPGDAPSHGSAPDRIAGLADRTMPRLPTMLAMFACALALGGLMAGAMREPGPGPAFAALAVITLCGADLGRRLRGSFGATASAGAALAARDRTITAMARATRTIAAQTDPDAIFQALGSACHALFETDLFLLASVDRDSREVRIAYALGPEPRPRTMILPEGRGLVARALRSPHPTLIHDIRSEAPSLRAEAVVVEPRIRAILSAPLSEAGRVTGLVSVQAFRPHAYTEEDSERLVMLAGLAALAAGRLAAAAGQTASGVDRLTGLVATDAFLVRLDEEIARGARYKSPVSVLRLAIDKDPTTALSAGRTVRDQTVGAIGELVRATIRRSDLVCRSGSGEFGVILAQCDLPAALQAAERLRYEAAQIRIQHGALRLGLTVTIGVSVFAASFPTDAGALWDEAGSALAEATLLGGDRVVASRKAR